jgi:hypothetical protein
MDQLMANTLQIAEQAIIQAWELGDSVERAQLSIAQDIVAKVLAQKEAEQTKPAGVVQQAARV